MIILGKLPLQYSSQVMSRVHALRGMRAREKLARVQGCFKELWAKPKSPESSTIARETSLKGPGTITNSLNIVTCSYNISVPYTVRNCYEHLVGGPFTVLSCSQGSWSSKYKQHCWVEYDSTGGIRQLIKCPACSCCVHGVSRENSLNNMNNMNNNNNNNRIFGLNILCVIQVKWTLGAELEA